MDTQGDTDRDLQLYEHRFRDGHSHPDPYDDGHRDLHVHMDSFFHDDSFLDTYPHGFPDPDLFTNANLELYHHAPFDGGAHSLSQPCDRAGTGKLSLAFDGGFERGGGDLHHGLPESGGRGLLKRRAGTDPGLDLERPDGETLG